MKDFAAYLEEIGEIGYVEEVRRSLAYVSGLPHACPFEIVVFETGQIAQVTQLKRDVVEVLLFSKERLQVGTRVARIGQRLSVFVGSELLGETIDPLGNPLDKSKVLKKAHETRPIDIGPSGIENRRISSRACETGVRLVDLIVPLGRGQRELVIGDRKTGKSEFALQAMLTQVRLGSICVFACIGKNTLHIKRVEGYIAKHKIGKQVVLIGSSSADAPGLIYLTPYTAMTIAEFFRDQGQDVLIVLDDLTTHAKFYREIALLGRRFPGRNSYPSDMFYTHARLLERAGNFRSNNTIREASITCLAIVETMLGDISGYIQTNLMSITDGHLYFDTDLFFRGRRPAINPFLSVTRLGRQTQHSIARDINREIMSALSLLEKTQRYQRFGAELTEGSKLALTIGEYITDFFHQEQEETIALSVQLVSFALMWNGFWREKGVEAMRKDLQAFNKNYKTKESVRKEVDTLVAKAKSLNELLGLVGTEKMFF